VGSIVCGEADLIGEIRYLRKRLGGGMRQAGVIAAAARVALAERDRLVDDHVLARRLGEAIAERFPGAVDPSLVETNMVRAHFPALGVEWAELEKRLGDARVKVNPPLGDGWRIVTHRDVDSADVSRLLATLG
jgi:threonine aldolase